MFKLGFEKVPFWECLCVHYDKKVFLSAYADDYKMAGRKSNIGPMWAAMKAEGLDLEPSVPLCENVFLGCGQREVLPDRVLIGEKLESFRKLCYGGPSGKAQGDLEPLQEPVTQISAKKSKKKHEAEIPTFTCHTVGKWSKRSSESLC